MAAALLILWSQDDKNTEKRSWILTTIENYIVFGQVTHSQVMFVNDKG